MPFMNGMQFLNWLRKTRKKNIPVIIITGASKDKDMEAKFIEAQVNDILYKPFATSQLLSKFKDLIDIT